MKFIDEVIIKVAAGSGGDGCCSFRREKFIPWGGPDGGNGGNGGSIYLKSTDRLHTLVDLVYKKDYQAEKGKSGSSNLCSGKSGQDLVIHVPLGTLVWAQETNELIGDLTEDNQLLLVANGGRGGLGNHHFKSSTNRSPRKIIKGEVGEERLLKLELRLLADVGLLGFPNAGKSTLISKISAAKPKIANYPFTTMQPHLGVVQIKGSSFVVADIPGLIEGAAKGAGLGLKFLRHLSRTNLLLHIVDLQESLVNHDDINLEQKQIYIVENIIKQLKIIEKELNTYNDPRLNNITRWIVVNKIDLLFPKQLNLIKQIFYKLFNNLNNKDKVFWISAINKTGVDYLCNNVITYLTYLRSGDGKYEQ